MEIVAIIDGMWAGCDQATKDRLQEQYHRSRLAYQEKKPKEIAPPEEEKVADNAEE